MLLSLLLGGCATLHPLAQRGVLLVVPTVTPGRFESQAETLPYSQSSIETLTLKLYAVDTTEQDLGIARTLYQFQLSNPVAFSNLKAGTTYRIKAFTYAPGGVLISTQDSDSMTEVVLEADDRPTWPPSRGGLSTVFSMVVRALPLLFQGAIPRSPRRRWRLLAW